MSFQADKASNPKHKDVEDIRGIREKHAKEQASKLCVLHPLCVSPKTIPNAFMQKDRKNKPKSRSSKPTSVNSQNVPVVSRVEIRMIPTLVMPKRRQNLASPTWKKSSRNTPKAVCSRQGEDETKTGRKRRGTKVMFWRCWTGSEGS